MTIDELRTIDPRGMYNCLLEFPKQVQQGYEIGKTAGIRLKVGGITNIVVTGLGGSAIGGDLLRSYLSGEIGIPIVVSRHYRLPDFVNEKSLVIVSSYSGNTEETIAAQKDATKRKARILCVSTGGAVSGFAKRHKQPCIKIPGGLQPRAALGFSFFPILVVLGALKLIRPKDREIKETIELLRRKAVEYGNPVSGINAPLQLAQKLAGKLPIVYSPAEYFDTINLRWRGQIAENAKQLAFGHVLPEMNHNELVGWNVLKDLMARTHVVFLRDRGTHPRVAVREKITEQILSRYSSGVSEVWSEGKSLLTRMFSLIHFGDWVSYYLAILNNQDPTPVDVIDYLKQELAKVD
jgi:glucose/mannose-6-phosphate isomerase